MEELNRDYVRTLYAKGLQERKIIWIHVLRNSLPPIIALAGVMLRTLLGYTLIVETIFRWPGLGYQLVNSVLKRDYTVAQMLAILLTLAVIFFNLLADIGQQWADPARSPGVEVVMASTNPTLPISTVPIEEIPSGAPGRTFGDRMAPLVANKLALFGGVLTLGFFVIAVLGARSSCFAKTSNISISIRTYGIRSNILAMALSLGTDNLGRSMFWRLVAGTAVLLWAGIAVTAISMSIGLILGAVAGYTRGWTDRIISALIDLTWGFPLILVAVIFVGMLQPGLTAVIVAISVVNWAGYARIVRAQVLTLKERAFIEAARSLGVPTWKIILVHLVPNMLGTMLVMASYYIAVTVIAEAGMSFIGLGAQPPTPSLGQMVSEGRKFLSKDPWIVALPGATIALLVLALNTLGDGLRDIFDPRLRRW